MVSVSDYFLERKFRAKTSTRTRPLVNTTQTTGISRGELHLLTNRTTFYFSPIKTDPTCGAPSGICLRFFNKRTRRKVGLLWTCQAQESSPDSGDTTSESTWMTTTTTTTTATPTINPNHSYYPPPHSKTPHNWRPYSSGYPSDPSNWWWGHRSASTPSYGPYDPYQNPHYRTYRSYPGTYYWRRDDTYKPDYSSYPHGNYNSYGRYGYSPYSSWASQPPSSYGTYGTYPYSSYGSSSVYPHSAYGSYGTYPYSTTGRNGYYPSSNYNSYNTQPYSTYGTYPYSSYGVSHPYPTYSGYPYSSYSSYGSGYPYSSYGSGYPYSSYRSSDPYSSSGSHSSYPSSGYGSVYPYSSYASTPYNYGTYSSTPYYYGSYAANSHNYGGHGNNPYSYGSYATDPYYGRYGVNPYYSSTSYNSYPRYNYPSNYARSYDTSGAPNANPTNWAWNCYWYPNTYATAGSSQVYTTAQKPSATHSSSGYGRRALMDEGETSKSVSRALRSLQDQAPETFSNDPAKDEGKLMAFVYSRARINSDESAEKSSVQSSDATNEDDDQQLPQVSEEDNGSDSKKSQFFQDFLQRMRSDASETERTVQQLRTIFLAFKDRVDEKEEPPAEQDVYFDPSMPFSERIKILTSYYGMLPSSPEPGTEEKTLTSGDDSKSSEESTSQENALVGDKEESGKSWARLRMAGSVKLDLGLGGKKYAQLMKSLQL
ncbi:adhesive plaque matrix protein-like [Ornithodoros turicata]|uniref:adhesive plaque matrix protein-like n=1 Tax=Ornithodoros turicata TaxID=34597 RepID=UPI00313911C1